MMHSKPPISKDVALDKKKDDVALDDKETCGRYRISKTTRRRWEDKYGMPKPDFYVGQRGFTWLSDLQRWEKSQPKQSALAGRHIPRLGEASDLAHA